MTDPSTLLDRSQNPEQELTGEVKGELVIVSNLNANEARERDHLVVRW